MRTRRTTRLKAEIKNQKYNRELNLQMAQDALRQRDAARVERDELRGALEMIYQITSEVSLLGERTAAERRIAQIAHETVGPRRGLEPRTWRES